MKNLIQFFPFYINYIKKNIQLLKAQIKIYPMPTVYCKYCNNLIANNAFKANIFVVNQKAYSTLYKPNVQQSSNTHTFAYCKCQICDIICRSCQQICGYHVIKGCEACLSYSNKSYCTWILNNVSQRKIDIKIPNIKNINQLNHLQQSYDNKNSQQLQLLKSQNLHLTQLVGQLVNENQQLQNRNMGLEEQIKNLKAQIQIKNNKQQQNIGKCKICLEKPAIFANVPCMHVNLCSDCATIPVYNKACIVCRQPGQYKRIFLSSIRDQ